MKQIVRLFSALCGFVVLMTQNAEAQQTDYCKYGTASSLFLIDRTTAYDETDFRVMIESVGTVVDHLGLGDRIVLATIDSHYSTSKQIVNACKPGCPVSNDLFSSCSAVRASQDQKVFKSKLAAAFGPLTSEVKETANSDIAGTISQWTQHPPGNKPFTHVYIFSDMLENSQAMPWAQFKGAAPEKILATLKRYSLVASVAEADIRIVGFGRLHDPGRPPLPADLDLRLRAFWDSYFKSGGAKSVSFEGAVRD